MEFTFAGGRFITLVDSIADETKGELIASGSGLFVTLKKKSDSEKNIFSC